VNRRQAVWLVPLLVFILGLMVWANYRYLRTYRYVHRDFMSLWGGGRALLEGGDPYDPWDWASLRFRYGSKWFPDPRNPFPLWTAIVLLPYSALPFGWGAAAWLATWQVFLGICVYGLAVTLGGRRPSLVDFALLLLGAYTFRSSLVTFLNGQITVGLLLVLTLFIWFMHRRRPVAAGVSLAFIILKPNPFLLFAPVMLLWLLWRRQWRVLLGGATTVLAALVITWLVLPGWLFEWLGAAEKTVAAYQTPTLWGVAGSFSLGWAPLIGLLLVVGVTAVIGWLIIRTDPADVGLVTSLAVVGSLLVTPYAWAYEQMLLLVPLILVFSRLRRRWLARLVWIGMVMVLPWILFRSSAINDNGVIEVVLTLATAAVLILMYFGPGGRPTSDETVMRESIYELASD
jgi:hypothetical protein